MGALPTPRSVPGSTTDAVGGPKALNSGWQIVQDKVHLSRTGLAVTIVSVRSYERYAHRVRLRKQSQFVALRLLPPPSRGQALRGSSQ